MLFRELLSIILHNVQANGRGALTFETPTPIDPRLKATGLSRPSSTPPLSKTLYNKSKKRTVAELVDGIDEATPTKKLDLGIAL